MYPSLRDHTSVRSYPDVPGVRSNLWFLDHREWEDAVKKKADDDVSKSCKYVIMIHTVSRSHRL